MSDAAISVVIPVHNGARFIEATIASVCREDVHGSFEVIVVDDGSTDATPAILRRLATRFPLRVMNGPRRGMAAAVNAGVKAATHALVAQVDQDVVVHDGWFERLTNAFDAPDIAAAQGTYVPDRQAPLLARVMGLDLADRYARLPSRRTDHVCTGNTIYRRDALLAVGLFDESLGYGCDNDMSYRLVAAGYRLVIEPEARSTHHWRDTLRGYLAQQYGFGYGRLDLLARHPRRTRGDAVSGAMMMLHGAASAGAAMLLLAALIVWIGGGPWRPTAAAAALIVLALASERAVAGVRTWRRSGTPEALTFPAVHLLRNAAWTAAILAWSLRRLAGLAGTPIHSMRGRTAESSRNAFLQRNVAAPPTQHAGPLRTLAIVPAHNEVANLPSVVEEIRAHHAELDILVVDDGSSDDTPELLEMLGVRWLRWPRRRGVGAAVRAGLLYARRAGFDAVIRLDADGQHAAVAIDRLLDPIRRGEAQVVLGTRYRGGAGLLAAPPGICRGMLAHAISWITGQRVTDPTSGFCAFGRAAIRLLADHHPDGYAEPELRLFLHRNGVPLLEVPVDSRNRLSGTTSLTPPRLFSAAARLLLALLIVPVRPLVEPPHD